MARRLETHIGRLRMGDEVSASSIRGGRVMASHHPRTIVGRRAGKATGFHKAILPFALRSLLGSRILTHIAHRAVERAAMITVDLGRPVVTSAPRGDIAANTTALLKIQMAISHFATVVMGGATEAGRGVLSLPQNESF